MNSLVRIFLLFIIGLWSAMPLQAQNINSNQIELLRQQAESNSSDASIVNESAQADRSAGGELVTDIQEKRSEVFGQRLFTGDFKDESSRGFNPDYQIAVGDQLVVQIWGAFKLEEPLLLSVDQQGNVFIPQVGPVQVLGVRNQELNNVVQQAIKRVYETNVYSYTNLSTTQPVKVFVTGPVRRPGLYGGLSSDSVLYFLDSAGGVDPERGSYREVRVLRNGKLHKVVDLYEFLISGQLELFQFREGDTIVVGPRKQTSLVEGLVHNENRFEFEGPAIAAPELFRYAHLRPEATHVRIVRNQGVIRNVDHFALSELDGVLVRDGDAVFVTGDKRPGTITVRVEGEHDGQQEYVLAYGSRLGELLEKVRFTELSAPGSVKLVRESVKERQKKLIQATLQTLETSVLTARSATTEESLLRTNEANLILKFIDRANKIEPRGVVVLSSSNSAEDVVLEDGDVLQVPAKSNLVLIHGEVLFPNAVVYNENMDVRDYVNAAGGFTQNANTSQILILHPDGSFDQAEKTLGHLSGRIQPGDEVLILPKVSAKRFQFSKELSRIIYELALAAAVVIRL